MTTGDESQQVHREVIVVGGGFAGLALAERLAREDVEVLLIDRNNYHQFKPLNYQVATSQLGISEVGHPLRTIFRRRSSVRVVVAEVVAIDPVSRSVTLGDGVVCHAGILVVGVGVDANFFGVPGAADHAYPMYTLADAHRLSNRLIDELDRVDSPLGMKTPLDLVIVGGGPTGVELAGAIAENLRVVIAANYKDKIAQRVTVHLVDRGHTLLKPFTEVSHAYARQELEQLGVRLHFGAGVSRVTHDGVELDDGNVIDAKTVVW
ncbi:MAG: FAD-dependent oxidoreductase, partial [Tomitella sp.]|nr:FAD-dependent oxidoreductase [Tomitella sp.]